VREASAEIEPATGTVMKVFTTGTVVQVFLLARNTAPGTWSGSGLSAKRDGESLPVRDHTAALDGPARKQVLE